MSQIAERARGGTDLQGLAVRALGGGSVLQAQSVRAGPWTFVTGLLAMDDSGKLAGGIDHPGLPLWGPGKHFREAQYIYAKLGQLLAEADTDLNHVVRLDQYYADARAVDPYHAVRTGAFGGQIAPSTSVIEKGLFLPTGSIEVEAIAVDGSIDVDLLRPETVDAPETSGFAPALRSGNYLFVAGQMATDPNGIAPDAKMGPGQVWAGSQIARETEYIITHRLTPCLAAGDLTLENIVKAQVYLRDITDIPNFNRVWSQHFAGDAPPTTIVPTSGLGQSDGIIEINVIASDGTAGKGNVTAVDSGALAVYDGHRGAVRVGDLVLIAGIMACDGGGVIRSTASRAESPYIFSSIEEQTAHILQIVSDICDHVGTDIRNVVRVQQFHTDLQDFYPAYGQWSRALGGRPVPFSAVEVPSPLPVPGARVLSDVWVYAPT